MLAAQHCVPTTDTLLSLVRRLILRAVPVGSVAPQQGCHGDEVYSLVHKPVTSLVLPIKCDNLHDCTVLCIFTPNANQILPIAASSHETHLIGDFYDSHRKCSVFSVFTKQY